MADRIVSLDGVIRHFPADATDAEIRDAIEGSANAAAGTRALHGGSSSSIAEGPPDWKANLASAMEPFAHPKTLNDMAPLLMMGGPGSAMSSVRAGAGPAVSAAGKGLEAVGTSRPAQYAAGFGAYHRIMAGDLPGTALAAGAPYGLQKVGQGLQRIGNAIAPAAEESAAAGAAGGGVSADQALLDAIAKRNATPRAPIQYSPDRGPLTTLKSSAATAPDLQPIAQQPPPNTASVPLSQPMGTPRVMSTKASPTAWTPESARARLELNDWHSGETGTPEAQGMQSLHIADAGLSSRLSQLLSDPKASWLLAGGLGATARRALLSQLSGDSVPPDAR